MNFDPFAQFGSFLSISKKMADDAVSRTQSFYAELEKAEARRVERVEGAIEEMVKLQKESLAYGAQLGAEMRKLSIEGVQRVASTMTNATGTTQA